ncbi:MAG: hypothetical protein WDN72_10725 [Alphaproteobacteria bacterium]
MAATQPCRLRTFSASAIQPSAVTAFHVAIESPRKLPATSLHDTAGAAITCLRSSSRSFAGAVSATQPPE